MGLCFGVNVYVYMFLQADSVALLLIHFYKAAWVWVEHE